MLITQVNKMGLAIKDLQRTARWHAGRLDRIEKIKTGPAQLKGLTNLTRKQQDVIRELLPFGDTISRKAHHALGLTPRQLEGRLAGLEKAGVVSKIGKGLWKINRKQIENTPERPQNTRARAYARGNSDIDTKNVGPEEKTSP